MCCSQCLICRAEEKCLVRSGLVHLLDRLCSLGNHRADGLGMETQTPRQKVSALAWAGFQVLASQCVKWETDDSEYLTDSPSQTPPSYWNYTWFLAVSSIFASSVMPSSFHHGVLYSSFNHRVILSHFYHKVIKVSKKLIPFLHWNLMLYKNNSCCLEHGIETFNAECWYFDKGWAGLTSAESWYRDCLQHIGAGLHYWWLMDTLTWAFLLCVSSNMNLWNHFLAVINCSFPFHTANFMGSCRRSVLCFKNVFSS